MHNGYSATGHRLINKMGQNHAKTVAKNTLRSSLTPKDNADIEKITQLCLGMKAELMH